MQLTEKQLESQTLYKGHILTLYHDKVQLENGRTSSREVVRHPGGVTVLALDQEQNAYFVRQFRYPYNRVILELPAGKLDKGNESPLEAGARELAEEIGMVAERYEDLGKLYPTPGYCDEIISMYLATGLRAVPQHLDDDEFLEVEKIPLEQAVEMVLRGEIPDAKTQTLLLKAYLLLSRGELRDK